jgi:hypothetical protein
MVAGFLAGVIILIPTTVSALQYQLVPLDQASAVLTLTGPIVPGDYERLGTFVRSIPPGDQIKAISIDSAGGNIVEAEKIAAMLNKWGLLVIVSSGSQCSSACFLLFAAAAHKVVAPDALIGVHSASDSGQEDIGSMAFTTAFAREAAAYGVPASIVGKIVQTQPNRVTWLDPDDLTAMGVPIVDPNTHQSGPADVTSKVIQDRLSSGELTAPAQGANGSQSFWVQIYSRALFSEAMSLGTDYKRRFSNIRIFKCDNGWYVLVLGPYEPAIAVETRDRLVNSGDIPKDSLVTQGSNYQQVVWGDEVNSIANTSNLDAGVALEAATKFFRASTLPNREALSFLDRVYPSEVIYFGKRASKDYVMAEKRAFIERWPLRAYSIRPGTISTSCDPKDNSCAVTGIVDWRASSPDRNAASTGSARFQLTFAINAGEPTLLSEWSEVLTRSNSLAGTYLGMSH